MNITRSDASNLVLAFSLRQPIHPVGCLLTRAALFTGDEAKFDEASLATAQKNLSRLVVNNGSPLLSPILDHYQIIDGFKVITRYNPTKT